MKVRVVKLGGSLLARHDWPLRLRKWLSAQPAASTLLVIGGGELVESVRQLDSVHHFPAEFVHWLCIDLLDQTAKIANWLVPECSLIETEDELQIWLSKVAWEQSSRSAIVMVTAFYHRTKHDGRPPKDWTTTSDTLAAVLAQQISADELVLLKSTDALGMGHTAAELSRAGIVDEAFALIMDDGLPFRVVNLTEARS